MNNFLCMRAIFLVFFFYHGFCFSARPLNILFVVGYFPSPSQTFILNLITGLIDRGHSVYILSLKDGNLNFVHPDIERYHLMGRVIYGKTPDLLPPCDIVFCQFGQVASETLKIESLQGWLKNKTIVTCFRGADISSCLQKNPKMYEELFKKGKFFLPVCEYFKQKLIRIGCDKNKIGVNHSAINCSRFFFKEREKPADNAITLISVCRLVEKKGIDFAIAACAKVVKKYPKVRFIIIGDGTERNYLEKLIKALRLDKVVTLAGWGTQEQVINALNKAHIFLLPSIISSAGCEEGIPNALKEAMAMGLPVIATWHAGNAELIEDGVSGFLVPGRDASALAGRVEYLIEHPEMWKRICLAARKKIENEFEIKKTVEQLEQIFYKLVEKR